MTSLWLGTANGRVGDERAAREQPRIDHVAPGRADVVVVGAGLAGLLTAWRLVGRGADVVVLEAVAPAAQTTGHTTAKITALHGAIYSKLSQRLGAEAAAIYATANEQAVHELVALIRGQQIECDLTAADAYTVAETPKGRAAIEQEAIAAAAAGLPVVLQSDLGLPFDVTTSVCLRDQAHFHPVRFCLGLTDALRASGAVVVAPARVHAVDEHRDGCEVRSDAGDIHARAVVLATHLPIVDPALLAARLRPERSYALAGDSSLDLPRGMYLSIDREWSMRPAPSLSDSAFIVGGQGHSMVDHVDTVRHFAALDGEARQRFGVERAAYRWTAFDYVTTDRVPYIGRLAPGSERRFVATGFGKWGMTTSMVAANLIADLVDGRENPYAELFDATRVRRSVANSEFASNSAKVAKRFVLGRVRTSGGQTLEPGTGCIERRGLRTVAVARDLEGTLHSVTAQCTHLGCIVGFNDAEQFTTL